MIMKEALAESFKSFIRHPTIEVYGCLSPAPPLWQDLFPCLIGSLSPSISFMVIHQIFFLPSLRHQLPTSATSFNSRVLVEVVRIAKSTVQIARKCFRPTHPVHRNFQLGLTLNYRPQIMRKFKFHRVPIPRSKVNCRY